MSFLQNVLVKAGLAERRKDGRVLSRGLDVCYWTGFEEKRVRVKDISATGLFLLTGDRWVPGTVVQLTLQKRGLLDRDSGLKVRLHARCVRIAEEGVGLTLVEDPATAEIWARSMAVAGGLHPGSHPVRLFRAAKAIAFLLRISPAVESPFVAFFASLCCDRAERVLEIVLQAEELLTCASCQESPAMAPHLLLRMLEDGSKAEDEQVRRGWAGLLASAGFAEAQESTLLFAALLSKLDRDHVAILSAACTYALRAGWGPGFVFSSAFYCSAEEIRKITGVRNLVTIEGNLNHLHHLGLLEKTVRPLACAPLEQVNITPTGLGLKLYVRMGGRIELPDALDSSALEMAS